MDFLDDILSTEEQQVKLLPGLVLGLLPRTSEEFEGTTPNKQDAPETIVFEELNGQGELITTLVRFPMPECKL